MVSNVHGEDWKCTDSSGGSVRSARATWGPRDRPPVLLQDISVPADTSLDSRVSIKPSRLIMD